MHLNDIVFLIGSYLSISDGEINEKEHKLIHQLCHPSDDTIGLQSKIFSDADDKVSLQDLVDQYQQESNGDYMPLLDVLFQAENADGYADPKEEEMIDEVAELLRIPKSVIADYRSQYKVVNSSPLANMTLSWSESLRAAFRALIIEVKKEDDNDENYCELLSGAAFAKKIKEIAAISQCDLSIAENVMTSFNSGIETESRRIAESIVLLKQIHQKDDVIESLVDEIVKTNDWIREDVRRALKENFEVLDKKKRTINYFTIAFMGRTKAGKSTFHKVVTHEEDDDIGVGKLRTTRFNRSFYWENLRIVDTPGIGAPGGKTDTETASSIIDEADLICYIVTDDSIQTTEFDFLRPLKERSKPLFIILNIKGDLDHPKRLERFMSDPLRWKNDKGRDDIQGHYDRISEALGDKYDMSMVEIIPLQLYAAILMNQPGRFSEEEKSRLLLGSNIQEYVRKVKKTIYKTGSLKKTQNIYDGCAYQIDQVKAGLQVKFDAINRRIQLVDKNLDAIFAFVDKERSNVEKKINSAISSTCQTLRNNTITFSKKFYDYKGDLSSVWNDYPDNKRANEILLSTLKQISSDFHEAVQDRINECLDDISFQQNNPLGFEGNRDIKGTKIIDSRFGAAIVSSLLTGGAPICLALIVSNPAGWLLATVTVVVGLVGWGITSLFKPKSKKIEEAEERLRQSILKSINENEATMLSQVNGQFNDKVGALKDRLGSSFRFVTTQSKTIAGHLKELLALSKKKEEELECMFVYRILQYLGVLDSFEDEHLLENVKKRISVDRFYGESSMTINKPSGIPRDMLELASHMTQIKITNT